MYLLESRRPSVGKSYSVTSSTRTGRCRGNFLFVSIATGINSFKTVVMRERVFFGASVGLGKPTQKQQRKSNNDALHVKLS